MTMLAASTLPRLPDAITPQADVLVAARLRDADAIAALYRAHSSDLMRLVLRLVGNREDAEDVIQDVFVALPDSLKRYDDRGAFRSWLRRIAARTALMHRRKSARRRTEPLALVHEPAAPDQSERVMARLTLDEAIAELTEPLRSVLVLYYIADLAHEEIAATLDISRSASEVRLHRAVRQLRALLENDR